MARGMKGEMRAHLNIRRYHVYNTIGTVSVGEEFSCQREVANGINQYAFAIKDSQVVGHLPRKISQLNNMFIGVVQYPALLMAHDDILQIYPKEV